MSYLIDALKKSERDRHARRDASLRSAAATDAPTRKRRGTRILALVIGALVAVNVVLLLRLWVPADHSKSERQAGGDTTETVQSIVASHRDVQHAGKSPTPAPATPQATTTTARSDADVSGNRDIGSLRLSTAPQTGPSAGGAAAPTDGERTDQRSAAAQSAGAGSVEYSHTPLSSDDSSASSGSAPDNADTRESDPDDNLPNQAQIAGAPQIDINGQLYSSVPGRSFILVQGRRYHEGEKLPEGPAIERITPSGATLRYRGKRYHVSGPGGG